MVAAGASFWDPGLWRFREKQAARLVKFLRPHRASLSLHPGVTQPGEKSPNEFLFPFLSFFFWFDFLLGAFFNSHPPVNRMCNG